jgi:cystathionine gamma-synthase
VTDSAERRGPASEPPLRLRRPKLPDWVGPTTRLLHGGRMPDLNAGAIVPPIYQTSTFQFPEAFSEAASAGQVHLYTREANPTLETVEEMVRGLEGAKEARVFSSGMGAIACSLLSMLRSGDEVVALEDLYGGTLNLLSQLLPNLGIKVSWVDHSAARSPEKVVPRGTRTVIIESPTNPLLRVHDIRAWADAAEAAGAQLIVDNTFATPLNQQPLKLGADLVIHSATKYLGGHSDLIAGVVAGNTELVRGIDETRTSVGAVLDPLAGFLLARGLKTLPVRVARQNESGRRVSEALAAHPKVEAVHYPGRASAVEEEVARRQMSGRGGVLSIVVKGGNDAAQRFLRRLRLIHVASSLGGVESLASVPSETSHRRLSESELARRGISEGLVRLSLGIEETEDLLRDLVEALEGTPPRSR